MTTTTAESAGTVEFDDEFVGNVFDDGTVVCAVCFDAELDEDLTSDEVVADVWRWGGNSDGRGETSVVARGRTWDELDVEERRELYLDRLVSLNATWSRSAYDYTDEGYDTDETCDRCATRLADIETVAVFGDGRMELVLYGSDRA